MTVNIDKLNEIFSYDKENPPDLPIGILVQHHPDPDCMGAAAGFAVLLKDKYNLASKIFHFGEISNPQNKSIKNVLHISLEDGNDFNRENVWKTVVLDTDLSATGFMTETFTKVDVRIDHHQMDRDEAPDLLDVRPVGSTCSIVWEYLCALGIDLNEHKDVSTAMLLGIKTDTMEFTRPEVSELDMEAFRGLLPYVNRESLARITNYTIPKEIYQLEAKAYNNKVERGTTLVSFVGSLTAHSRDAIATIADKFVRMAGINTVVIMAIIDDHLQASIRSYDARVDVNDLCIKVFSKKYAGAKQGSGGARMPLANSFKYINDKDVKEKIITEVIETFTNRIFETLGEEEKDG